MLLRAFLLMLFSSSVWSAGVTIDVDLSMTIEEIKYTDPDRADNNEPSPVIEDENIEIELVEDGECVEANSVEAEELKWLRDLGLSLTVNSRPYYGYGNPPLNFYDEFSWSIYDDLLQKLTRSWDLDCPLNPRLLSLATNIENVEDVFVFESLDLQVLIAPGNYVFHSSNRELIDIIKGMPKGYIKWLSILDEEIYVGIDSGFTSGVWKLGQENVKLQNTGAISKDSILKVGDSLALVTQNTDTRVKFLKTNKEFRVDDNSIFYSDVYSKENGVLVVSIGEDDWSFKWLNGYAVTNVQFQNGYLEILDCYQGKNQVFCIGLQDENETELTLWRLNVPVYGPARFVVDAKFDSSYLENKTVEHILYSEGARHLIVSELESVDLLTITSETTLLNEIGDFKGFSIEDGSAFVLYEYLSGEIVVNILSTDLQAELTSLIEVEDVVPSVNESSAPDTNEDFDEREEDEVGNSREHPRAELSGALSMYYILAVSLLLVTVPRRRLK